ncbi:MAG: hypothetical protein R3F49_15660 [Planctomycetota bacterium]
MKQRKRLASAPARTALALALLGVASAGSLALAVQAKGDTLTVTRKVTKLRNAKRAFATAVADLAEGDRVVVVKKDGAWFEVTFSPAGEVAPTPLAGFVHAGDVSAKKDIRLSGEGVRETYTSSEAAAARKGFNPEVEREHRANNPDLDAAFQQVDAIQARAVSDAELMDFLTAGGLGLGSGSAANEGGAR